MEIITDFNNYINIIFNKIELLDNDFEIQLHHKYLKTIMHQKPDHIIKEYYKYLYPYSQSIYSGDENFFFNLNYSEVFGINDNGLSSIFKFTNKWKQLNTTDKHEILNLLQIITLLSEKYNKFIS